MEKKRSKKREINKQEDMLSDQRDQGRQGEIQRERERG